MEGIADKVRLDQEGDDVALRFILRPDEGHPVAVELRGEQVCGVLDNGDAVVLQGVAEVQADGLRRPDRVENKTTGSTVTVGRTSSGRRTARHVRTASLSAAVSAVVSGILKPAMDGARSLFHSGKAAKVVVMVTVTGAAGFGAFEVARHVSESRTQGLLTISWSQSTDASGYSVAWTRGAKDVPDATPELPASATSARSERLPQGRWYFHRRTIGGSEAGEVKHVGPFDVP